MLTSSSLATLIIKMPQEDSSNKWEEAAMKRQHPKQMDTCDTSSGRLSLAAGCTRPRKRPPPLTTTTTTQHKLTHFSALKRLLRTPSLSCSRPTKSLILLLVLVATLACVAIAKPNNNNININNNSNQNQNSNANQGKNQQASQLTDKQLIRKAQDSSESLSRDGAASNRAGSNSNQNSNSNASSNGGSGGSSSQAGQEQSSSASASSSSSVFSCPEQFGYYTDTKDCTKYYVCVFGEVLHESCTGGLRFSRELQTCDWPRNVDCPSGQPAGSGADSSAGSTAPFSSTTSGAGSSTSASSSSSQATTMSSFASTGPSTTPASATTTANSTATSTTSHPNQVAGNGGGRMKPDSANSMAFADEASDPQQPSFDEAISPVITADGAIHLHDGSGGTFGLAPNHNRALQSPQSLNGPVEAGALSGANAGRNVDVFVMPISISSSSSSQGGRAQQALRPSSSGNNKRQQEFNSAANSGQNQARQQHQLVSNLNVASEQEFSSGSTSGQSNGANANKVLLPATLPPRARQQQQQQSQPQFDTGNANGNGNDITSRQTASDNREDNRDNRNANDNNNFRDAELSDESGDFNLGSANGQDGGAGAISLDSEGNANGDDSLSAQADQDAGSLSGANGNEHDAASSNAGDQLDSTNNNSADNENNGNIGDQQPIAYVPPVLANTFPAPNLQINANGNINNNNNNRPPNRQQQQASSPLLSINNRQIVDPTRQTFKPIIAPSQAQLQNGKLISSSSRAPHSQADQPQLLQRSQLQPNINLNANTMNLNTNRQMNLQQQGQQQQQQPPTNRQSRMSSGGSQAASFEQATPQQQARPRPLPLTNTFQAPNNQSARFFVAPHGNNQQLIASNVNSFAGEPQQPKVSRLQASPAPPIRQSTQTLPQATFQARFPSSSSSSNFQQNNNQQQTSSLQRSQQQQQQLFPTPRPFNTFNGQPAAFNELPSSLATSNFSSSLPLDQFSASADQFIRNNEPALQSVAPRRPRPPKRNQIPNQNRRQPNPLLDFDTTTTTSTTTMSTPLQRFQTTNSNFNTPPTLDNGADGSPDANNEQAPLSTPGSFPQDQAPGGFETPAGSRQQEPMRPLVASNNFRDASAFSTQQPPSLSSTAGQTLARPQRPQLSTPTISSQQFRSSTTQAATTTLSSNPATTSERGATGSDPQTTADPQSVANRYLNSAIDALEAGQPFGTVDYDFDILNDNQTDRRQAAAVSGDLPLANLTAPSRPSDRAQTITRQRLQQQAAAAAVAAAASQDQGDGQEQRGRARGQPAISAGGSNQPAPPTKKPRPTNKKIVVNHEQALLNNRASTEPARRPEPLFATPQPLQTATKCDTRACRLPDCKCGDTLNPGGLEAKAIPQIVLLTFDDAVNDLNWEIYEELFSGRTNPNGCPVLATFYVSHEWTDYGQVQTLYSRGHEMASHSVTHSFGEKFSKNQWFKEINGQREILNMYGGVKMNDVRGMRAPFLQIGGNKMFEMLYDANFTYDSSMPIFENSPPLWPYTLDYQLAHECMITPCPTKSFPGVWEVGMTMWVDLRGGRCSMGDACSNPTDEDGVYEMLMKNFNRHYKSNRAPFGLFYHSAWFNTVHHRRGFLRFMSTVNALPEVFFVTNWQMLQWMRQPTPLSEINSFEPWQCPAKNDRPPPCHHPAVCNVKSEHGTRFMKTCQPCPANQQYPWVGSTGFNKGKQSGSG